MRISLILVVSLSLLFAGCLDEKVIEEQIIEEEMKSFPDFSISAHDGSNNSLEELNGTYWIAYFSAPWCSHCESTIDAYDQVMPDGKLLVFSTDSSNEQEDLVDWHDKTENNLNRAIDRPFMLGSEIGKAMNVSGIPHAMIIDKDGTVIDEKIGKSSDPDENLEWWEFYTN